MTRHGRQPEFDGGDAATVTSHDRVGAVDAGWQNDQRLKNTDHRNRCDQIGNLGVLMASVALTGTQIQWRYRKNLRDIDIDIEIT